MKSNSVNPRVLYCSWPDKHKLPQYFTHDMSSMIWESDGKYCECFKKKTTKADASSAATGPESESAGTNPTA
jgi:hypothetical protein